MEKLKLISVMWSITVVLATPGVHALNKCEAQFATREQRLVGRAEVIEKEKAAQLMAAAGWAQAARDGKSSVDPALLQDVKLEGQPESAGITRLVVTLIKGLFEPKAERETLIGTIFAPSTKGVRYGTRSYIEFPNSTMMTTEDEFGTTRAWILTRGVRKYKDRVNRMTGEINPRGYVSDVLLFELVDEKPVFHSVYLESAPELKFLFEDPRISVRVGANGKPRYFLSGTDYSPHIGEIDNPKGHPDVMNRFIELHIDAKTGEPLPVAVDETTKRPAFRNLSPPPVKKAKLDAKGKARFAMIDAKNATIAQNEFGEIVLLPRLRPDFKDPDMLALFNQRPWDYAEQAIIFANEADFEAYDFRDLMVDLAGQANSKNTYGSVRPTIAKELIRSSDLKEHLKVPEADQHKLSIIAGEKGLGPGTRPIRLERSGDLLLASDGPGLPKYISDVILPSERETFPMRDGEVIYGKLDHEIRKLKQKSLTGWLKRRHYSASAKFLNARMDQITDYLPDVIQPKNPYELGKGSGILDLLHVYPMGIGLIPAKGKKLRAVSARALEGLGQLRAHASRVGATETEIAAYNNALAQILSTHGRAQTIATVGISDAHTSLWGVNWKILITEARRFTAESKQN